MVNTSEEDTESVSDNSSGDALLASQWVIPTQADHEPFDAHAMYEKTVLAKRHSHKSSVQVTFHNHRYERRGTLARRLDPAIWYEFAIPNKSLLYEVVIDEGRVPEAQRKIDARVHGRCGLHRTLSHLQ